MLRIAVCDDDNIICSQIESMLLEISKSISEEIEIETFFSGEELCRFLTEKNYFDILFLDIELNKLNGVEVGKIIREEMNNETTQIVYISAKDSYAMELFQVRPLHFLIKPIQKDVLEEVVNKAIKLIVKNNQYFEYKNGITNYLVPFKDIIYFESDGRKVNIIMKFENQCYYGKLSEVEKQLYNQDFILIHKSFLVNYDHVLEYQYDYVKMSDNEILPISQNNRKTVREQLLHRKQRKKQCQTIL